MEVGFGGGNFELKNLFFEMIERSKVRLAKLTFHKLDWLEYLTVILSVWFFIHPKPYKVLFVVLLCMPILGLFLNSLKGRPSVASLVNVWEDRHRQNRYDVSDFIEFAGWAILVKIFIDYSFESFYSLIIPGSVAFGIMLIILFATHKVIEASTKSKTWIYCSLFLNILVYSFGATYGINCVFDDSDPVVYDVEVVDKIERKGKKKSKSYYIEVTAWGHHYDKEEISVTHEEYDEIQIGQIMQIDVKEGFLGIPWYYVER